MLHINLSARSAASEASAQVDNKPIVHCVGAVRMRFCCRGCQRANASTTHWCVGVCKKNITEYNLRSLVVSLKGKLCVIIRYLHIISYTSSRCESAMHTTTHPTHATSSTYYDKYAAFVANIYFRHLDGGLCNCVQNSSPETCTQM